jgi:two-component system chemotaxis family response regulator WspR
MTGLFNRRHFMSEAPKLWRQAARNQQKLLFILLDVDKFKEYNDTQGHQAGDEALIRVAQVLQQQCQRSNDIALRMGGEEMAILSLIKTEQEAIAIAERILTGMQLCAIPHPASGVMPFLTVSIGLSIFDGEFCHAPTETNIDKLYALADAALYQAKSTGRNRAVLAQEKVTC